MKKYLKNIIAAQRYMLRFTWKNEPFLFVLCCLEMLAESFIAPVSLILTQRVMHTLETGAGMKAAVVCIIEMVLFGAAMRLAIVILQHFTYWRKVTLSEKLDLAIFEKTCNMDLHILDTPEMQTLYNEAGEATNNYRSVKILEGVFTLISSLVSIVLTATIMVGIEPWVLLVFAITIGVKTVSVIRSKRQQFKNWKLNNELQKEFNYHMNLLFDDECAQEMRMTGLADWITKKYARVAKQAREVEMSSTNEITLNKSVDAVMSYLQTGVLYAFLAYKVIFKELLLSEFTVFLTGMQSVSSSVSSFIAAILDTGENAVYLQSYMEYMEVKNTIAVVKEGDLPCDNRQLLESDIVLDKVSFHYPGSEQLVLENVDLSLEHGKFYMIVGENGAGKTTLVKLLCRLYDPTSGSISVGGNDIKNLNYRDYRGGIGIVFQDYKVYEYPIGENIAMDKWDEKNPPKDRIDEVLKKVHLDRKINSLPKGIFTPLGRTFSPDGINLSGGETQKVAMAKALFNDKAILILDEPSSALDAIAENELIDSMFDAGRGKTIFYISHRLSAARRADKIIFMSGRTVEAVGTHEELLKTCPGYARMYHAQADNYQ